MAVAALDGAAWGVGLSEGPRAAADPAFGAMEYKPVVEQAPEHTPEAAQPAPAQAPPSVSRPKRKPAHLDDIQPAYFYPMDAYAPERTDEEEEDEAPVQGVPVFTPTMEQFADFYAYCQAIDRWGMQSGIVKIVPPKEWTGSLPSLGMDQPASDEIARIDRVRIKNAITQHFLSAGPGRWKQTNVTRAKVWDAKQWSDLCLDDAQRGPPMARIRAKAEAAVAAEKANAQSRLYTAPPESAKIPPREDGVRTRSGGASTREPAKSKAGKTHATSGDEWAAFDYRNGWTHEAQDSETPPSPSEWTPQACRAIESEYWRSLNFGKPPMYGADLQGTLFDQRTTAWNVGELDSLLSRRLKHALPGVTTPYLYFGMWRASFAWHVEDMDLYSINYIHFGAPKQWYAIRQADRQRFESVMAAAFPTDSRKCPHFMRHKSFLASPTFLASQGIRPLRLVQHAQEFVITYPYGYHSGYNMGYNCAESVNFALPTWIDIGREADYCKCELAQESVHFDIDAFFDEPKTKRRKDAKPKEETPPKAALVEAPKDAKKDAKPPADLPYACVFCVSPHVKQGMVPVPREDVAALQRSAASKKSCEVAMHGGALAAHQLCACFIPETYVSDDHVQGAAGIEKARWGLKCQSCTDPVHAKHGAKIQCTKGRCPRAVHVGCALAEDSGWFLDFVPEADADRLEGVAKKSKKGRAGASVAPGSDASAAGTPVPGAAADGAPGPHGAAMPPSSEAVAATPLAPAAPDAVPTPVQPHSHPTATPEPALSEDAAERLVVLCRAHNPLRQQEEAARREQELAAYVRNLEIGGWVHIKSGSGVWTTRLRHIDYTLRLMHVDEAPDELPTTVALPLSRLVLDNKVRPPPPATVDHGYVLECKVPVRRTHDGTPADGIKETLHSDATAT